MINSSAARSYVTSLSKEWPRQFTFAILLDGVSSKEVIFFFNLPWIPRAEALPVPNFQVRNEHDKTESIRRSAMETEYFSSELISSLDIYMREKNLMLQFRILLHPNKNFSHNPSIFKLITRVKELKLCIYS